MHQPAHFYQNRSRPLYHLKLKVNRPMTDLARDAVDLYLARCGGIENIIPPSERVSDPKQCL